ncbi:MAG: glycoside hydrolase family 95 protein [Bacteroidetes bacterium]|nr:glycoside hydrolase family 95 protein [Bacteroidota bacterium]
MKKQVNLLLLVLITFSIACTNKNKEGISEKLWYKSPAKDWFSALPLGNGRLGAMVFGTLEEERIQMNEESLWAGCPEDPYPENIKEHYHNFQELNLRGNYTEALDYAMSNLAVSPTSKRSYTTLGELFVSLNHKNVDSYRRELNLETGINTVEYEIDGKRYSRESFVSDKYNAMFFHFKSLDGAKMEAAIRYEREKDVKQYVDENNVLCIDGQIFDDPDGYDDNKGGSGKGGYHMKFASRIAVKLDDGNINASEDQLLVKDAEEFTVIVSAATDYNLSLMNFDRNIDAKNNAYSLLNKGLEASYNNIKREHIKSHSEIYNRVDFCITDIKKDTIPTDERINRLKENKDANDNYLTQVFFQYGRYLLMGSSGGQAVLPATLQGVWNKDIWAAWESDYHLNINLQMNYWPADVCNLSETFNPLSDYVSLLSQKGKTTANNFIGSQGWMAHHTSTPFGRTTPSGSSKMSQATNGYSFPLAGAWMSISLWRHYEFTQDKEYLDETVYPVIKGASQFILDFLIENEKGELVTAPSYSPENAYINPKTGKPIKNTVAATMDIQIINELFKACLSAEEVLGKYELTNSINKTLPKLPKVKTGADGTIQEWYEDYKEARPGHRHISHLFGFHPGTQITPAAPKLYDAALRTLEKRLSSGGGQTGWSRAWVINFYARFFDGNACNNHINALLASLVSPNLFDLHPPYIFQIDGNLGATAGMAEMLIQSHEENTIRLLPALPDAWKTGHVKGLKARGAYEVDMEWKDDVLENAKIYGTKGAKGILKYGDKTTDFEIPESGRFLYNQL